MPHDAPDAPTTSPAAGGVGRRWVLSGGIGVAAAVALAGCGDDSGSTAQPSAATDSDSEKGTPEQQGGGGTELGPASDVAVGGGAIYADQKVVVTQPTEGEFRAFDTTCTHSGCPVDAVTETINCPCHGSAFSLEDGSVVAGPASGPLAAKDVTVEGGTITLS